MKRKFYENGECNMCEETNNTMLNLLKSLNEEEIINLSKILFENSVRLAEIKKEEDIKRQEKELRDKENEKQRLKEERLKPIDLNKYTQKIEFINGFKIINNIPIMTDEERKEKEKESLIQMYNILVPK